MKISNKTGARRHFSNVGALVPERSAFDLSYSKTFTCDMGELIPVMCDEVVPGDVFKIGCESVIRFQPLIAPVLHEINQYVHYFFVPYRILWNDWENFITGGVTGNLTPSIPRWSPTNNAVGSLWDYLGFPTGIVPTDALPLDFPRIAYNVIFNHYYRDESLVPDVPRTNEAILNRAWEKDYFTSSLLSAQRGTPPALPVSGTSKAVWPISAFVESETGNPIGAYPGGVFRSQVDPSLTKAAFDNNTVDLSSATPFSISDFRLAFQIQRWLERNNRAGARYTEFLKAHFGVSPRDERLHRPEYIGGTKSPIIVSEVLQTSSTDGTSPQGHLAGHGISVNADFCGKYHATEYGLIMGIMSVMPRTMYQQGINRQWLRRTKYDFYFREFANLSEQAVERAEIYATAGSTENRTVFGYAGRYDEMRVKNNMVCGDMRQTFAYWHLGRMFSSAPALNETFIKCVPRKDIFAVPSVDGLIVSFGNKIHALRPMPVIAEPGMIDHY
nr:MAG: major capsid protein [Microvirus sp.]